MADDGKQQKDADGFTPFSGAPAPAVATAPQSDADGFTPFNQETAPPPAQTDQKHLQEVADQTGIIKGSLLEKAFKLFNPEFEGGIDPEDLKKADEQGLTLQGKANKVFFGEGSALTTELSPEVRQDIEGLKSLFKGQFGDAWDKLVHGDVGSVHVVKGSPLEKIIQSFDHDFQGGISSSEVDEWKRKYNSGSRPIADLGTLVDKDKNPMLKAIAETAGSLTTPENLAMLGSGALGIIGGGAKSLAVLHKLFSAGFGIEGLKGLYEHSAAFKDAMDKGDVNEAMYQATHAILSGGMTAMSAHDVASKTRYDANGNIIPSTPVMSEFDKKVAGKVADVATSAREFVKDRIPKGDTLEDLWYKLAKPSALQDIGGAFREKIGQALPALKEIINKNPIVESPADVYKVTKKFQNSVRDQLVASASDPNAVVDGLKGAVEKELNQAFDDSKASYTPQEREKAIDAVMEHMTVDDGKSDVSLSQAERARKRFNDDIEPEFGKPVEAVPSATMFAKEAAAKILRDKIDAKFDSMGVEGVKEWRTIESALIEVRDQFGKANTLAERLGVYSPFRSFLGKIGWHSILLGLVSGEHIGWEGGVAAGLGDMLLSTFYEWRKDRNTNPNTLIDRIIKKSVAEGVQQSVAPRVRRAGPTGPPPGPGGAGFGPQPQAPGPRFVPGAGGGIRFTPNGVEGLPKEVSPVNSPLHTALANFYGEPLGDNFEELENRFLTQVIKKNMRGQGPTEAEAKVLNEFNKYRETSSAQQAKLDEKAQKEAQEVADKKAEQEAAGINTNTSAPFEVGPEMEMGAEFQPHADRGHSPASIRAHELGHQIMTALAGWIPKDIIGHLHDQIRKGAWAEARWDKSPLQDENGKITKEAAMKNYQQILDMLHGGPIAEELVHGIPIEKNAGANGDLIRMKKVLKGIGFKDGEIGAIMKASEQRVRDILTTPGVREIIERYTRNREAGLDEGVHMSEETLGKAIQEAKKALGVTNGKNKGQSSGEGARGAGEDVGRGEGKLPSEGKGGPRPAGKAGAGAGEAGEGAEGSELGGVEAEFRGKSPYDETPHEREFRVQIEERGFGAEGKEPQDVIVKAHSRKEALDTARKQYPGARPEGMPPQGSLPYSIGYKLTSEGVRFQPREIEYSVPKGKLQKINSGGTSWQIDKEGNTIPRTTEDTMIHEYGHLMGHLVGGMDALSRQSAIDHGEAFAPSEIISNRHRMSRSVSRATTIQDTGGAMTRFKDIHGNTIAAKFTPESLSQPGALDALMHHILGGVAADEVFGKNTAETAMTMGGMSDANQVHNILEHTLKMTPAQADTVIKGVLNSLREKFSHPVTSQMFKENVLAREKGLSAAWHLSPDRSEMIKAEHNRRMREYEQGNRNVSGTSSGEAGGQSGRIQRAAETAVSTKPASEVQPNEDLLKSEFAETDDQKKGLISTRQPEGKFATEDPLKQDLKIGAEQFQEPKFMQKVANKIKSYGDLAIPDAIKKDPTKIVSHFINHMKNNLIDLHNQVAPEVREQTAKWYDSASGFAKNMAEKFGYSHKQGAGVIAAMSPQKDWDQNVSLAERVTEAHATQKNTVTSKAMETRGNQLAKARNSKGNLTNPSLRRIMPAIKGKTLGELLPTADMSAKQHAVALLRSAAWIRLFDETNNPRSYQKIDPGTGAKMGEVLTDAGVPRKVAWGSFNEIGKAISILQDGSRENISNRLGGAHKVRNFYNNILDPNNPAGHVTIDTHAVAAAHQQPFSGKSKEVQANFGGLGSKGTGSRGLYGLYAEAYRQAAQQLGIQPRQLQSIVWEKVRQQFPDEFKRAADGGHVKAIRDLWSDYDMGNKTLDETREAVRQYARENTGGKEVQ